MSYVITNRSVSNTKYQKNANNKDFKFKTTDGQSMYLNSRLFLDGFIAYNNSIIVENNLSDLANFWPLPDDYSGSYSFCLVSKEKLVIANDCIGLYPLYYYIENKSITVSNNLYELQKNIRVNIDIVGKYQRLNAPEYSEIGNRTILKDVKRLLPGEKITYDLLEDDIYKEYDNRLYNNIKPNKSKKKDVRDYWNTFKKEVNLIENMGEKPVNIALSGGMDSRILIGAMSPDKNSKAFTYGSEDFYEVKIAKKLALKLGFKFRSSFRFKNQFPEYRKLNTTIKKVGAPYVMSWYDIFDIAPQKRETILLGDMCEALPARNIKKFSSRSSRVNNFIKNFILNKDYQLTKTSKEKFEIWKNSITDKYTSQMRKSRSEGLSFVIAQTKIDLEQVFSRIDAHQLPFSELYDELFSWYTHSRIPMGKQILHCNERFFAYAPAMSTSLLIATSNLHPNQRLNYRFMNKLFKQIPKLNKLNNIPVNQVPLLSRNSPDFLQFLVWGLRSKIDQILINRLMKHKNINMRYRLFKSLNWVLVYQNDNMIKTIDTYFLDNQLPESQVLSAKQIALNRKKLKSWPLANNDIMSLAVLNIELTELNEYANKP